MTDQPMNCRDAAALLHDYFKRELTPEVTGEIRRHLDRCRHCADHAEFERKFLALLEERGRRQRCPEALRARILDAIRSPSPDERA